MRQNCADPGLYHASAVSKSAVTPEVIAGFVKWRLEFRHVASPVARLLLPEADGTSGIFAVFGKVGHSPRVYASRDRDALLKQLQTAAYKKMGLTLAGVSDDVGHRCIPACMCTMTGMRTSSAFAHM